MGAYHTLDIPLNLKFSITKDEWWEGGGGMWHCGFLVRISYDTAYYLFILNFDTISLFPPKKKSHSE